MLCDQSVCAPYPAPPCRRSSRFELVAVNRLNFSEFDLRDNVGLMAVLKHKQAAGGDRQQPRSSRMTRRPTGRRSRSGRRVAGSSSESTSSSESEESGDSSDGDRAIPVPRVALRAAEERAAARSDRDSRVYYRRAGGGARGRSSTRDRDMEERSLTGSRKARGHRRSKGVAAAVAAAAEGTASLYGQFVAVANTHVLFNPKRGDIKLAQLRLLLHHLQVRVVGSRWSDCPIVSLAVRLFSLQPCTCAALTGLHLRQNSSQLPCMPAAAAGC